MTQKIIMAYSPNNVLKSYKQTDICIRVHYKITYHHLTLKLTKYTEPFYQSHKKCKKINKCGAHRKKFIMHCVLTGVDINRDTR